MNGFITQLENRPGEMARLMEALSAQGVNVLIYAVSTGDQAAVGFVVNDEEATRSTRVSGDSGLHRQNGGQTWPGGEHQSASSGRGCQHRVLAAGRYQPS